MADDVYNLMILCYPAMRNTQIHKHTHIHIKIHTHTHTESRTHKDTDKDTNTLSHITPLKDHIHHSLTFRTPHNLSS